MNTDPTTPQENPVAEPRWPKVARSVVSSLLALTFTFIVGLAVLGHVAVAKDALEPLLEAGGKASGVAAGVTVLLIVLLPLAVFFVASRKRWLTWRMLGAGWVVAVAVLAWLAWDEPAIRQPLSIEEFSPTFAGAGESFGVLMRYSKQISDEETKAFGEMKWKVTLAGVSPKDGEKWREFIAKNRAGLEEDWAALAPQRRWLDELNAFERIGDLTPPRYDANIIRFDVWRALSQRVCAQATMQAMDGHGDEAVATLLPLLQVGRKLQPSARTLVRFMIAVVVERMAVQTAGVVLDAGEISPESRARLGALLQGRNAPAGARRILLMEYAGFGSILGTTRLGDQFAMTRENGRSLWRRPLNFLSSLLINPNATTNLLGKNVFELAALAEARELGKLAVRSKGFVSDSLERGGMKNLGGRMLLVMAVPSYDKILESYWKLDDDSAALWARLMAKE